MLVGCSAPGFSRSTDSAHVGRAFYVSQTGDDRHDGLSPGKPWRSLAHAGAMTLHPGDRLLLQGGVRFRGTLRIGRDEAGNASVPVIVGSYGAGRATIEASGGPGITVADTAGVEVRDLMLVGDASAAESSNGLNVFSDLSDGRKLDHITVSDVDVTGFKVGIAIGGTRGTTGFRDVQISDTRVHGNVEAGLMVYGPAFDSTHAAYANEAVSVSRVEASANLGNPAVKDRNTGSGIVLSSVSEGRIERSSAHGNGSSAGCPGEGPEGIWTYDSTGLVIEHNVSYQNRTGTKADGGGFGLDNNVTSSVLQYNLSYGNDGPGYLLYMARPGAFTGNILRFNISHNDARNPGWYGSIHVSGQVADTQVYNNTVVAESDGRVPSPAMVLGAAMTHLVVRNNVFVTGGGALMVSAGTAFTPEQVLFQGNDYFSSAAPWSLYWGTTTFTSLDAWRSATGQERLGSAATGLDSDPRFVDETRDPAEADALVPRDDSPLIGRAVDQRGLLGVDQGPTDYFGRPIKGSGTIGAAQPVHVG